MFSEVLCCNLACTKMNWGKNCINCSLSKYGDSRQCIFFIKQLKTSKTNYSRNLYSGPFPYTMDPLIIPAEKGLRAKVYQWLLWGLIWGSLTPFITMTLNPLVLELIWKLIYINFLMQLLSTFEHAHRAFSPKKIILNTRWGI